MSFDQALSPRIGQRAPNESTTIRIFAGSEIPEASWRGQMIYRSDRKVIQVYNGDGWEDVAGGVAGLLTFVGPEPPVAQSIGDIWYDSDNGNLPYRWSGTEWEPLIIGPGAIDPIYPTTINIEADRILDGTTLAANIYVTGGVTAVGESDERVGLTGNGFFAYGPPDVDGTRPNYVRFPVDGSTPYIKGNLEADQVTVSEGATLQGTSMLSEGSILKLASRVENPIIPPTSVVDYHKWQLSLAGLGGASTQVRAMTVNSLGRICLLLARRGAGGTSIRTVAEFNYNTKEYIRHFDIEGMLPNWFTSAQSSGVPVYLFMFKPSSLPSTLLRASNEDLTVWSPSLQLGFNWNESSDWKPTLGYNHATDKAMLMWHYDTDTVLRHVDVNVNDFNLSSRNITLGTFITQSGIPAGQSMLRAVVGQPEGQYWVSEVNNVIRFTNGTAHENHDGRGWMGNGDTQCLIYTGGYYWGISESGLLTRFENGDYYWNGPSKQDWTATYTYVDDTGTPHETGPSSVVTTAVTKRALVTWTAASRPTYIGSEIPTKTRFYINSLSGGTQTLRYKYFTTTGDAYTFDGETKESTSVTAPTNNFEEATPASIESVSLNSAGVPKLRLNAAGVVGCEQLKVGANGSSISGLKMGSNTVTTDASSDITIAHGLGATPTHAIGIPSTNHTIRLVSLSSTNVVFRCREAATGALTGNGVSVGVHWQVSL